MPRSDAMFRTIAADGSPSIGQFNRRRFGNADPVRPLRFFLFLMSWRIEMSAITRGRLRTVIRERYQRLVTERPVLAGLDDLQELYKWVVLNH